MARPDRFDYIGMVLVALVLALWVAHFVLPAPPPDESRLVPGVSPGGLPQSLPSIRPR